MTMHAKRRNFLAGRSGRKEYWVSVILTVVLLLALTLLVPSRSSGGSAAVVVWLLVFARRLHDIGRSGWWGVLAMLASAAPLILALVLGGPGMLGALAGQDEPSGAGELWLLVGLIGPLLIQFGFTLWLGLQKGDAGDNRFGPPPSPRAFGPG